MSAVIDFTSIMQINEFAAKGYVPNVDGSWSKPKKRTGTSLHLGSTGEARKLERNIGDGALGKVPVQRETGGRFLVVVKSFRKRLLDEDNLCCKYHVDLLRYSGVIPADTPGTAKIQVCQEKVGPKEPERTVLTVYKI
jgi:hypothetical protein